MNRTLPLLLAAMFFTTVPAHAGTWLGDLFGADEPVSRAPLNRHATDAALAAADGRTGFATPLTLSHGKNSPQPLSAPAESSLKDQSATVNNADAIPNFGAASGTAVGQRAAELHEEVARLHNVIDSDANSFMALRNTGSASAVQYHSATAAIMARLQNGTTRGNPILERQWHEAEQNLNAINDAVSQLNMLSTKVVNDASLANYLLESIQAAFQISGAVDEDHAQLTQLRDETSRLIVQVDFLRTEITGDIQRQTAYLAAERNNLQALSFAIARGEIYSGSLANRPLLSNVNNTPQLMAMPPQAATPRVAPTPAPSNYQRNAFLPPPPAETADIPAVNNASLPSTGKLLVLIRFDQKNVAYERQLAQAVATALDRRPDAQFTIVSVTPMRDESRTIALGEVKAGRYAEKVKDTLLQMGLAASKITVANTQGVGTQAPEVHIYVR